MPAHTKERRARHTEVRVRARQAKEGLGVWGKGGKRGRGKVRGRGVWEGVCGNARAKGQRQKGGGRGRGVGSVCAWGREEQEEWGCDRSLSPCLYVLFCSICSSLPKVSEGLPGKTREGHRGRKGIGIQEIQSRSRPDRRKSRTVCVCVNQSCPVPVHPCPTSHVKG